MMLKALTVLTTVTGASAIQLADVNRWASESPLLEVILPSSHTVFTDEPTVSPDGKTKTWEEKNAHKVTAKNNLDIVFEKYPKQCPGDPLKVICTQSHDELNSCDEFVNSMDFSDLNFKKEGCDNDDCCTMSCHYDTEDGESLPCLNLQPRALVLKGANLLSDDFPRPLVVGRYRSHVALMASQDEEVAVQDVSK